MKMEKIFKLLSDRTRLRILMLLDGGELCVCHLMAALGVSQPLVSKNLSLLSSGGFLSERRDGKLVYYGLRKDLAPELSTVMRILRKFYKDDPIVQEDMESLKECKNYQKQTGRCDMETSKQFMRERKRALSAKRGHT